MVQFDSQHMALKWQWGGAAWRGEESVILVIDYARKTVCIIALRSALQCIFLIKSHL